MGKEQSKMPALQGRLDQSESDARRNNERFMIWIKDLQYELQSKHEGEVFRLHKNNIRLEEENRTAAIRRENELRKILEAKEAKVTELEKNHEEERSKAINLQQDLWRKKDIISHLRTEIITLKTKLQKSKMLHTVLHEKYNKVTNDKSWLHIKVNTLENRLEQESVQRKKSATEFREKSAALEEEKRDLKQKLKKKNEEVNTLIKRLEQESVQREKSATEFREKNAALEEEKGDLKQKLKEKKEEVNTLEKRLKQESVQREKWATEIAALKEEKRKLEQKLKRKEGKIDALKNRLNKYHRCCCCFAFIH